MRLSNFKDELARLRDAKQFGQQNRVGRGKSSPSCKAPALPATAQSKLDSSGWPRPQRQESGEGEGRRQRAWGTPKVQSSHLLEKSWQLQESWDMSPVPNTIPRLAVAPHAMNLYMNGHITLGRPAGLTEFGETEEMSASLLRGKCFGSLRASQVISRLFGHHVLKAYWSPRRKPRD